MGKNADKHTIGKKYAIVTLISAMLMLTACGETVSDSIRKNPSLKGTERVESTEVVTDVSDTEIVDAEVDDGSYDFTICFAGDVSLAEGAITTANLDAAENGVYGCISETLVSVMQDADVMCLNNEFTYSTNGSPMAGKAYTFRADPSRVEVLKELGVDIVGMANNHVYDYGKQALLDTFDTLDEAQIPYFGAGHDLAEAMQPVYMEVDGKTVAFVAASRAEKNIMTPEATEDSPGILRCYDTTLFKEVIAKAKENADFVIAYVHWGTEYSTVLEEVQTTTAKEYLDAGADAIIGAHPHILQGMEYYDGKPIIYSLGNFWFNSKTLDTMLIQLHFEGNDQGGNLQATVVPAIQKGGKTYYISEVEEQKALYDYLESISVNVVIDDEGNVFEEE